MNTHFLFRVPTNFHNLGLPCHLQKSIEMAPTATSSPGIGIANLPNQRHKIVTQRGANFTLMVCGKYTSCFVPGTTPSIITRNKSFHRITLAQKQASQV